LSRLRKDCEGAVVRQSNSRLQWHWHRKSWLLCRQYHNK